MELEDLKEIIANTDPSGFCKTYLFDESMWYFDSHNPELLPDVTYTRFKQFVAEKVDIGPENVALGGSSKFGFSLNPDERQGKLFRQFSPTSDLDLIIVAPDLFQETWHALKVAFYNEYYWVMTMHSKHIFRGFIFLDDKQNYRTKYLKGTQKFMRSMSAELVAELGISRELKYRIYESWDDVLAYHEAGIQKIQRVLADDTQSIDSKYKATSL